MDLVVLEIVILIDVVKRALLNSRCISVNRKVLTITKDFQSRNLLKI